MLLAAHPAKVKFRPTCGYEERLREGSVTEVLGFRESVFDLSTRHDLVAVAISFTDPLDGRSQHGHRL